MNIVVILFQGMKILQLYDNYCVIFSMLAQQSKENILVFLKEFPIITFSWRKYILQ